MAEPMTPAAKRAAADQRRAARAAAKPAAPKPPAAPPKPAAAVKPPAPPANDEGERGQTKRVVLRRERVIVLPEGVELSADAQKAIAAAMKVRTFSGLAGVEAWLVVGEFEGDKRNAIEQHAGEPNTPTAKPGTYKAPSVTSWKGGRHYERPPEPKVEVKDID